MLNIRDVLEVCVFVCIGPRMLCCRVMRVLNYQRQGRGGVYCFHKCPKWDTIKGIRADTFNREPQAFYGITTPCDRRCPFWIDFISYDVRQRFRSVAAAWERVEVRKN